MDPYELDSDGESAPRQLTASAQPYPVRTPANPFSTYQTLIRHPLPPRPATVPGLFAPGTLSGYGGSIGYGGYGSFPSPPPPPPPTQPQSQPRRWDEVYPSSHGYGFQGHSFQRGSSPRPVPMRAILDATWPPMSRPGPQRATRWDARPPRSIFQSGCSKSSERRAHDGEQIEGSQLPHGLPVPYYPHTGLATPRSPVVPADSWVPFAPFTSSRVRSPDVDDKEDEVVENGNTKINESTASTSTLLGDNYRDPNLRWASEQPSERSSRYSSSDSDLYNATPRPHIGLTEAMDRNMAIKNEAWQPRLASEPRSSAERTEESSNTTERAVVIKTEPEELFEDERHFIEDSASSSFNKIQAGVDVISISSGSIEDDVISISSGSIEASRPRSETPEMNNAPLSPGSPKARAYDRCETCNCCDRGTQMTDNDMTDQDDDMADQEDEEYQSEYNSQPSHSSSMYTPGFTEWAKEMANAMENGGISMRRITGSEATESNNNLSIGVEEAREESIWTDIAPESSELQRARTPTPLGPVFSPLYTGLHPSPFPELRPADDRPADDSDAEDTTSISSVFHGLRIPTPLPPTSTALNTNARYNPLAPTNNSKATFRNSLFDALQAVKSAAIARTNTDTANVTLPTKDPITPSISASTTSTTAPKDKSKIHTGHLLIFSNKRRIREEWKLITRKPFLIKDMSFENFGETGLLGLHEEILDGLSVAGGRRVVEKVYEGTNARGDRRVYIVLGRKVHKRGDVKDI